MTRTGMGNSKHNSPGAGYSSDELRQMIARHVGADRVPRKVRVHTDTTDFFRVDYGDVLVLADRPFFIRNYEREGRFGIDEEPKFWVRRAIDLEDGGLKIIKMVFHERFTANIGGVAFECVRSSRKEARILEMVKEDTHFMHGVTLPDSAGNQVRVIDYIHGRKLSDLVLELGSDHEDYFFHHFPAVLDEFIQLVRAIQVLHDNGEKHGDIRRDHIIRDRDTGQCRWIDFDFNYYHKENFSAYDLYGLGNVLAYLMGRGDVTVQKLRESNPAAFQRLSADDLNIVFRNRMMNLKKVFPYIPDSLNLIVSHFSAGANMFYDDTGQLLSDLEETRERLR